MTYPLDDFWASVDAALTRCAEATTVEDVITILNEHFNPPAAPPLRRLRGDTQLLDKLSGTEPTAPGGSSATTRSLLLVPGRHQRRPAHPHRRRRLPRQHHDRLTRRPQPVSAQGAGIGWCGVFRCVVAGAPGATGGGCLRRAWSVALTFNRSAGSPSVTDEAPSRATHTRAELRRPSDLFGPTPARQGRCAGSRGPKTLPARHGLFEVARATPPVPATPALTGAPNPYTNGEQPWRSTTAWPGTSSTTTTAGPTNCAFRRNGWFDDTGAHRRRRQVRPPRQRTHPAHQPS